jgi:hypothetical protein
MYSLPSHVQFIRKFLKFNVQILSSQLIQILCLYLKQLLHSMFQPIWPLSGALKLLGEIATLLYTILTRVDTIS